MQKPRTLNGNIHPGDVKSIVDAMFNGDYQNPVHQSFKRDAEAAGYKVEDYRGRYNYFGPCVKLNNSLEFQNFLIGIKTKVILQWDDLGKSGKVVYPR